MRFGFGGKGVQRASRTPPERLALATPKLGRFGSRRRTAAEAVGAISLGLVPAMDFTESHFPPCVNDRWFPERLAQMRGRPTSRLQKAPHFPRSTVLWLVKCH